MLITQLPQPTAAQLAIYIEAHEEAIFERWCSDVRHDKYIPSSATIDAQTLRDHLPQMIGELCDFLRQDQQQQALEKIADCTEIHGRQRWLQGFSLSEVLLEVDRFREILLIDILREFAAATADTRPESMRQIANALFVFTRELIVNSAVEHTEFSESQLTDLNLQLSVANAKLTAVNQALREKEAKVRQLSFKDPLTNIANRRYLDTRLTGEITRCSRYGQPFTVVLLDLDHFKKINDTHGHEVGDRVLIEVARQLLRHTRSADIVGRYGGEEFLLLLPNTSVKTAKQLVERIIAALSRRLIQPLTQAVTASFGIAQWHTGEDKHALVARADKAMYRAKDNGRNRFEVAVTGEDAAIAAT